MIIRVGSKNPVKVEAVKEYFSDAEVESCSYESAVLEQPRSLTETIFGAKHRSRCWSMQGKEDVDWGVGIESGIMLAEHTTSGWINIVACCINDGQRFCVGMGSGFVVPDEFLKIVFQSKVDLSEAAFRADFTPKKRIGYEEGIVNILTDGGMNRKEYIKQAIMMAMIEMNHPELYANRAMV